MKTSALGTAGWKGSTPSYPFIAADSLRRDFESQDGRKIACRFGKNDGCVGHAAARAVAFLNLSIIPSDVWALDPAASNVAKASELPNHPLHRRRRPTCQVSDDLDCR